MLLTQATRLVVIPFRASTLFLINLGFVWSLFTCSVVVRRYFWSHLHVINVRGTSSWLMPYKGQVPCQPHHVSTIPTWSSSASKRWAGYMNYISPFLSILRQILEYLYSFTSILATSIYVPFGLPFFLIGLVTCKNMLPRKYSFNSTIMSVKNILTHFASQEISSGSTLEKKITLQLSGQTI